MDHAATIVLAAGSGVRFASGIPKAFAPLGDRSLLERAVANALAAGSIGRVIAVVPPGTEMLARDLLSSVGPDVEVIGGGETRAASTRIGLALLDGAATVLCHDAARPLASPGLFDRVIAALGEHPDADGVIPVVPVVDTVKRVTDHVVVATEVRESLALAQTPQAFRTGALIEAHDRALRDGVDVSDDSGAIERAGGRVIAVPGEVANRKITTPEDLAVAAAVLDRV